MNSNPNDARRFVLLQYDIPQGLHFNPSSMLWRFGARSQLSSWFIPERNVPVLKPVTDRWVRRGQGIKVDWFRMDERDAETVCRKAREVLLAELADRRAALDESVDKVRERILEVASGDKEGLKKARAFAQRHVREAKRLVVNARECALAFDILSDVGQLVNGLRDAARAKDALFYSWLEAKEKNKPLGTEQDAVAARTAVAAVAAMTATPAPAPAPKPEPAKAEPEPEPKAEPSATMTAAQSVFGCCTERS